MKTPEQVLETLAHLATADREWILQALSEKARSRLREWVSARTRRPAEPEANTAPAGTPDPVPALPRLEGEPTWILALVLSIRSWPWQEALLAKLPPDQRLEVVQLRASLPRASAKIREALMRALVEQARPAEMPDSPFERTLSRACLRPVRRSRLMKFAT